MSDRAFRAVVFDLDGTLVDSYPAICASVNHARRRCGGEPLDATTVRRMVGRGLEALMVDVVGAERAQEGVTLFREHYAEVYRDGTSLLPGVAEALDRLSAAGIAMAVASNKPARFGRPICEALGIARHMATVEGPDTAGRTKPEPAMLRNCLRAMGSGVRETLYVGDMVLDAESGRRAGLATWLVQGGSSELEALEATGCPVWPDPASLVAALLSRSNES